MLRSCPCKLGSTHPCSISVVTEPFSTSALTPNTKSGCYYHHDPHRKKLQMNLRSTLPRHWCAPLHLHCQKITRVWTQQQTLAPSILRVHRFGRWVVTHSQVDVDLYDHLPAVPTVEPLFWSLGQFTLWRFSQTFGSFPIAIPSYQK